MALAWLEWSAAKWLFHGLITSVLSGVGFLFFIKTMKYVKGYCRNHQERTKAKVIDDLLRKQGALKNAPPGEPRITVSSINHEQNDSVPNCENVTSLFQKYNLLDEPLNVSEGFSSELDATNHKKANEGTSQNLWSTRAISFKESPRIIATRAQNTQSNLSTSIVSSITKQRQFNRERIDSSGCRNRKRGQHKLETSPDIAMKKQLTPIQGVLSDIQVRGRTSSLLKKDELEMIPLERKILYADMCRRILTEYPFILPFLRRNLLNQLKLGSECIKEIKGGRTAFLTTLAKTSLSTNITTGYFNQDVVAGLKKEIKRNKSKSPVSKKTINVASSKNPLDITTSSFYRDKRPGPNKLWKNALKKVKSSLSCYKSVYPKRSYNLPLSAAHLRSMGDHSSTEPLAHPAQHSAIHKERGDAYAENENVLKSARNQISNTRKIKTSPKKPMKRSPARTELKLGLNIVGNDNAQHYNSKEWNSTVATPNIRNRNRRKKIYSNRLEVNENSERSVRKGLKKTVETLTPANKDVSISSPKKSAQGKGKPFVKHANPTKRFQQTQMPKSPADFKRPPNIASMPSKIVTSKKRIKGSMNSYEHSKFLHGLERGLLRLKPQRNGKAIERTFQVHTRPSSIYSEDASSKNNAPSVRHFESNVRKNGILSTASSKETALVESVALHEVSQAPNLVDSTECSTACVAQSCHAIAQQSFSSSVSHNPREPVSEMSKSDLSSLKEIEKYESCVSIQSCIYSVTAKDQSINSNLIIQVPQVPESSVNILNADNTKEQQVKRENVLFRKSTLDSVVKSLQSQTQTQKTSNNTFRNEQTETCNVTGRTIACIPSQTTTEEISETRSCFHSSTLTSTDKDNCLLKYEVDPSVRLFNKTISIAHRQTSHIPDADFKSSHKDNAEILRIRSKIDQISKSNEKKPEAGPSSTTNMFTFGSGSALHQRNFKAIGKDFLQNEGFATEFQGSSFTSYRT